MGLPPPAQEGGPPTRDALRETPPHAKMTKESLKTLNGMKWHLILWSIVIPDCFMPKKHAELWECEGIFSYVRWGLCETLPGTLILLIAGF